MIPELGPEPPALANLLAHDLTVTHEAMPATLIDLAARRVIRVVEIGPDHYQCEVRNHGTKHLAPYEGRIIQLLNERAEGGVIPAGALTTGWDEESRRWSDAFTKDVLKDASDRGLTRSQNRGLLVFLAVGLLALAGCLALALVPWEDVSPPLLGLPVLAFLAAA